jgi:hypothetical protein
MKSPLYYTGALPAVVANVLERTPGLIAYTWKRTKEKVAEGYSDRRSPLRKEIGVMVSKASIEEIKKHIHDTEQYNEQEMQEQYY